jgi:hypothetical protein
MPAIVSGRNHILLLTGADQNTASFRWTSFHMKNGPIDWIDNDGLVSDNLSCRQ